MSFRDTEFKTSLNKVNRQKDSRLKELELARSGAAELERFISKQYGVKVAVGFDWPFSIIDETKCLVPRTELFNFNAFAVEVRVYYKKHSVRIGYIKFKDSLNKVGIKKGDLLKKFVTDLEAVGMTDLLIRQPKACKRTRIVKKRFFFNQHELSLPEEEKFYIRQGLEE